MGLILQIASGIIIGLILLWLIIAGISLVFNLVFDLFE